MTEQVRQPCVRGCTKAVLDTEPRERVGTFDKPALTWENIGRSGSAANTARTLTESLGDSAVDDSMRQKPTCAVAECGGKTVGRGLCKPHYWKAAAAGTLPPLVRPMTAGQVCSVDDCDGQVRCQGLCTKHYGRLRKWGDPNREPAPRTVSTCTADCDRPAVTRGLCVMHYARWLKHGTPHTPGRSRVPEGCIVEGCEKPAINSAGHCMTHRSRMRRTGSTEGPAFAYRWITSGGYVVIKAEGHPVARTGDIASEHRVVLYDQIGPAPTQCHWCAMEVRWDLTWPQHANALVVDHLDEDKLNNDPANLVPSCSPCNVARSSRWVSR